MGEHVILNPKVLVGDLRKKGDHGQWKMSREKSADAVVAFAKNWAINVLLDISHDEAQELWEAALEAAKDVPGDGADLEAILTIRFKLKEILKRKLA